MTRITRAGGFMPRQKQATTDFGAGPGIAKMLGRDHISARHGRGAAA